MIFGKPIFFYDNLLKKYAVTVTSEDADYPKENLFDDQLQSLYKPTAYTDQRISINIGSGLITNGDFETGSVTPWAFWIDATASVVSSASNSTPYAGVYKGLMAITSGGTNQSHIQFYQGGIPVVSGKKYKLSFRAKAAAARTIAAVVQKNGAPWPNYGLVLTVINLTTSWQLFEYTFTANITASDGRLQFRLGNDNNDVEFDDIALYDDGADTVDIFCLGNVHDLNSANATVTLQHSTTGAWAGEEVDAFTGFIPATDNSYQYQLFTPVSARYWSVLLSGMTAIPQIGEMAFGSRYTLPRWFDLGFDRQRKIEGSTNVSDGGQKETIIKHRRNVFPCSIKNIMPTSQDEADILKWRDAVEDGTPFWFLMDQSNAYELYLVSMVERTHSAPFQSPSGYRTFAFTLEEEL